LYYSCVEPHLKILGSEANQTIASVVSHVAKEITTWRKIQRLQVAGEFVVHNCHLVQRIVDL
jgi:hypothetical protein